ncbi:[protein-PII] uridylyltransferase [Tepidiphilus olei]|uniref:[protein-PII] uridylyltransferase n=1 Tax=Tepidiphilus olei TaxID=2502184 RepID=UPI00115DFDDF|nr:[protein-PII] uridylyltransferase [Tepidiphilus olei]
MVSSAENLAPLKDELASGREALARAFLASTLSPARYLARHAHLVDETLRRLLETHPLPRGAALLAVGGYGRGELYPHSDIDVLILLAQTADAEDEARVHALVAALWDVGLQVGASVRTIEQSLALADEDITVATTLLETRLLAGSRTLYHAFRERYRTWLDPRSFYEAKRQEQEQRHARMLGSPFALEPNCKEHPGGLRDLQLLIWIARALGYRGGWAALATKGLLTPAEAQALSRCQSFIARVRIHLHLLARRAEDRLLFDHQEKLAQCLDIAGQDGRRPAEVFMQRYYLTVKQVLQLNAILMATFAEALFPERQRLPFPINERFQQRGDRLDVVSEDTFVRHPEALLEVFLLLAQRSELTDLTARTLRLLWAHRELIDDAYHLEPRHQALFLDLLKQRRGIVHGLRRMNQFGILSRYLPPWRRIICQMQYDLYHAYTVDTHTLMVVRNLRCFTMGEHAHEYPAMNALMFEFGQPWLLYLAALFHDIGKGRGGDHSLIGAEEAERFCREHRLDSSDAELVVWLVRHHLEMSRTAQKEDISDPEAVARFATLVGDERRLIALYLLTHADIRGTSPKVWTPWKERLLHDLFEATRRHLRQSRQGIAHDPLTTRLEDARRLLRFHGLRPEAETPFWHTLDTAYFLRHSPEEIAWHTRILYGRFQQEEPVVRARLSPEDGGIQLMVYTRDAPELLLRLIAYLTQLGLEVWEAKIHTTHAGHALDSFVLRPPNDLPARELLPLLEYELPRRLSQPGSPPEPDLGSRRLPRLVRHFPFTPQIHLNPDERGLHYVLNVTAIDQPGLLYKIVRTLARHGIAIDMARIDTLGERAEDTFLIRGDALESPQRRHALVSELTRAIDLSQTAK